LLWELLARGTGVSLLAGVQGLVSLACHHTFNIHSVFTLAVTF